MKAEYKWRKDDMNDYIVEIDTGLHRVNGRIIRCPIVKPFGRFRWNTKGRWLLLVNNSFYGFWKSCSQAMQKFDKDCVPHKEPVDDDYDGVYYCWHGDKPFGPGPYCTGCGGLIKRYEGQTKETL